MQQVARCFICNMPILQRFSSIFFFGLSGPLLLLFCHLILVIFPISLFASASGGESCTLLHDFEDEHDLERFLTWECHSWYQLDRNHSTHGAHSLRVELYPWEKRRYQGISLAPFTDDVRSWKGWHWLRIDFYNPASTPLSLTCRIDDRRSPPYSDRFNQTFSVPPGPSTLILDLLEMTTSGTGRPLEMGKIRSLLFFVTAPKSKLVFYMDNVRLCR